MRKIALLLGVGVLIAAGGAQAAPSSMSFAGRLTTSTGPVNGAVSVTFSIFRQASGGTAVWTDTLTLTADQGLVFATLGNATNPLDDTVFTGVESFLEITVQSETLTPRLPIGSSPYAIRSTSAASADSAATLGTLTQSQVVTSVTAGTGLAGGGSGGNVALSIDTTKVQSRITGSCPAGQSIQAVAANGTVTCEVDANTTYVQGPGISINGTMVSLASCPSGQILKSTGTGWSCQNDSDTTYAASTGISINGTNQISVDSTIVARKDAAAGNQAFDTNTLFLDYTNNRVGIGTATPSVPLDVAGVARVGDLQYASPLAAQVIASPNSCTRTLGDRDLDTRFVSPPSNLLGPSISDQAQAPNASTTWFCPVALTVPPGGVLTITKVTIGFFDNSANCRMQAELRTKTFGTSDFGTIVTTIFSGTDANDFASASGGATLTKAASVSVTVPSNLILWVSATVAQNATGGGDCRYSGALIDYTVTHP